VAAGSASPAIQLRGLAAGSLTVALATTAHAAAGGGTPSGAAAAQLVLLAVVIGALSATIGAADRFRVQLILMAAGQVLGHLLLGTVGHHHHETAAGPSATVMVAAHLAAVACGAALIAVAGYLCTAISRAVRTAVAPIPAPVSTASRAALVAADQPLRSALQLAASMSHRGPPVGAVR
jgi:hypothetical protein